MRFYRTGAIAPMAALAVLPGMAGIAAAQSITATVDVSTERSFVPLQSYVHGRTDTASIFLTGLEDMGLHFFGDNAFPTTRFSISIYIVDEATGTIYSGDIGHLNGATRRALRVTAAQAVQFGDTLWIYGGWGPLNNDSDFTTRATVLSVDLGAVETAVRAGSPVPQAAFAVTPCDYAKVTGGGIVKFGDDNRFALICGADMPGAYGSGSEPIYSHAVHIFDRAVSMTEPVQSMIEDYFDSPLHRRDINTLPVMLPALGGGGGVRDGFVVASGVFQGGIFPWENPIIWGDGDASVFMDLGFTQHIGAYEGPCASLYSESSATNHLLIAAGLSAYNWSNGQFVWNPATPWTSEVVDITVVDGAFSEETIIGAMPLPLTNAHLIIEKSLPTNALGQVLLDALPADTPVLLGRIYGGIEAEMPADSPPTYASDNVLDVFITVTPEPGVPATLVDFAMVFGSHRSGGVAEASSSDDQFLVTRSQFGFSAIEPTIMRIHFGFTTGVASPASLDIAVESRLNTPNGVVRVGLKRWDTDLFTTVHTYPIGVTETVERISGLSADQRVRSGDGRIELEIHQYCVATFSALGFDTYFDMVGIDIR